jgi:catechol 2,3-dioxygenase-like lactoylglutathione lyase family enzyme
MGASRINHVSVNARDLEASVAFYTEVLGAVAIATPNFGLPVQWLAFGDTQLHLFERALEPSAYHHFALTAEDLEPIYAQASERGALDAAGFGHHLFVLPGDVAQLYLRDPAGNLVEVDAPHASRLPEALQEVMRPLADVHPQSEENLRGRLFVGSA